jgi:hypothetical protein
LDGSLIDFENFLGGLSSAEQFFSANYSEAKSRWLEAARKAGAEIKSVPLGGNSKYSIDYAKVGSPNAQNIFLHISGTHGIEGFLGSAIQLAILTYLQKLPDNLCVIFVHCLNPWGMDNLRRVTEENIDLNRNFQPDDFTWNELNVVYRKINNFLNPKRKPTRLDPFLANAVIQIIRHGYVNLKQGIAGGQYGLPEGIYFGGHHTSRNIRVLRDILSEEIKSDRRVFGLEIHSGLGPYGYDTLFSSLDDSDWDEKRLEETLNHPLSSDDPKSSVGFKTKGDISSGIRDLLGKERTGWILQEFGTFSNIRGLKVLRNENMHHFYGDGSLSHWSKKDLMEFFNPASVRWRRYVIGRGLRVFDGTLRAF